MLENSKAFSGFSVDDLTRAREFYGETLGLRVEVLDEAHGLLTLHVADRGILVYGVPTHVPASYTVLNFPVDDVEGTVRELTSRGVQFERYEATAADTDELGIFRGGGPLIAWFRDPAGNVLSIIQAE